MTLGLLRALKDARDAFQRTQIVGFDHNPEERYYDPPHTTVRQDFVKSAAALSVAPQPAQRCATPKRTTIAPVRHPHEHLPANRSR